MAFFLEERLKTYSYKGSGGGEKTTCLHVENSWCLFPFSIFHAMPPPPVMTCMFSSGLETSSGHEYICFLIVIIEHQAVEFWDHETFLILVSRICQRASNLHVKSQRLDISRLPLIKREKEDQQITIHTIRYRIFNHGLA